MRILASILDPKSLGLVGFLVSGTQKEFLTKEQRKAMKGNNLLSEKIKKPLSITQMASMNFNNSQLKVDGGRLIPQNNFEINKLPAIDPQGNSVNNSIEIKERLVSNGVVFGFTVLLCGNIIKRIRYMDIVQLSSRFNPVNFFIKYIQSTGPNGKPARRAVVVGKAGMPLENLPAIEMAEVKKQDPRKENIKSMLPKDKDLERKFNEAMGNKVELEPLGLVEMFDWLHYRNNELYIEKKTGAYIVKFPSDEYIATTKKTKEVSDEFIQLGFPEIGEVQLDYGTKKLNANVLFKKLGVVMVNQQPVYTFTYSKKSIFESGKPHLGRFGIAIEASRINELYAQFGKERFIKQVDDQKILQSVRAITGNTNLEILEVETKDLKLMAEPTILSNLAITSAAVSIEMLSAAQKKVDKALKHIDELMVEHYGGEKAAQMKGLPVNLRMYEGNDEMLRAIALGGISLKTGAFEKTKEFVAGEDTGVTKDDKVVKQKEDDTSVMIEYIATFAGKDYKADLDAVFGEDASVDGATKLAAQQNTLHTMSSEAATIAKSVYGFMQNYEAAVANKDAVSLIVGKNGDVSTLQSLQIASKHIKNNLLRLKRILWIHKVGLYNEAGLAGVIKGFEQTKSLTKGVGVYTPKEGLGEEFSIRIKARG